VHWTQPGDATKEAHNTFVLPAITSMCTYNLGGSKLGLVFIGVLYSSFATNTFHIKLKAHVNFENVMSLMSQFGFTR
jgi:hypothetical protein